MREKMHNAFQNVRFKFSEMNHFQEDVVPVTDSYSDMLMSCNGSIPTICCRPELVLKSGWLQRQQGVITKTKRNRYCMSSPANDYIFLPSNL